MSATATQEAPRAEAPLPEDLVTESRAVLAHHARSFRWASALLPKQAHDEAAVLYNFCRLVDDIADETPDPVEAARALEALRQELSGAQAARPLVTTVRDLLDARGVGVGPALELIHGVVGDLQPVRVADDAELLRYCYRVAGTVGLMMTGVLGVRSAEAHAHALDLGVGMQLTNICRDVLEDAGRARTYLPASRLARHGVTPEHVLSGEADREAVSRVVLELLELAEAYYRSADEGMRFIPWRRRLAILVASRVYRAIGLKLKARGGDALAGRVWIGRWGKLAWSFAALLHALRLLLRAPKPHNEALHLALAGLPGARVA